MKEVTVNGRTLKIRQVERRDARLLADLGADTFADTYSTILPTGDLTDYLREAFSPERVLEDIADDRVILFLGSISKTACSYIKLQPTPVREVIRGDNPIELVRLYVQPEWKGLGIGGALLELGLAAARDKGYTACWLKVWQGNTRAIDFYENRGFSQAGSEPYPVGGTSRDVLLMVRPIES